MPAQKKIQLSPSVKEDPVSFAQTFLINPDGTPFTPHETQQHFLRGIKPLTTACCGRQWGKSVGLAAYVDWFAVTHAHREVYIIAPTLDQSRIIFNEVAFQFRNSSLSSLVVGKINEFPFPKMELANGTKIHARGANSPQYIRGKPGHLFIVDEAAFIKDGTIPKVIEPMLTVTGRLEHSGLILISTPFGLGDFHEYYMKAGSSDKSSRFHFTSLDNPYADRERLEDIKRTYGEDSLIWRTEYMAEFVDDDLAVFSSKDIKWAYENFHGSFPAGPMDGHKYVSGVDLANIRDYFVASLLDVTNPNLFPLVKADRFQKKGYTFYKNLIRSNYRSYNRPRTLIDATSLGESITEDLRDINAEGYKFTNQSKYEIVHELARLFAEHRLTIPYDRTIIDELRYFSYKFTPSKTLRMEATGGKHDDIVMSLALAAHLAIQPTFTGFFAGVDLTPKNKEIEIKDPWSFDEE
jgi:hypothetical protein